MDAALKADDLDAWAAADERFHQAPGRALPATALLADAVCNFWRPRAPRAHVHAAAAAEARPLDPRAHGDARRAIRAGDAARRVEVHRAHRERGSRELLAIFERYRLHQM